MSMKIGCHVSSLQSVRQAPYEEAMENAGRLGFDGVELIAMDRTELDTYYTGSKVRELREVARREKLDITQFAVYSPACEELASLDQGVRDQGIEAFERGIQICRELGCDLVNLVAHWPLGLGAPIGYPPSYIHPSVPGIGRPVSPKLTLTLPDPFDFAAIWRGYVETLRTIAELAASYDVRFAIEGHSYVIVSGADAMLRLFDEVTHPAAVVNLDTSWHLLMREYLPMSVAKLRGRIAHVQCRDGDGLLNYGLPPGQGIIDWPGLVAALAEIGYDGYLSVELSGFEDHLAIADAARRYLAGVVAETTAGAGPL